MTPRAAAQRISQAAIDAMAAEWNQLQDEFEPQTREAMKSWVWEYVRRRLVGTTTIPAADDGL
jgi:hypothetical protein